MIVSVDEVKTHLRIENDDEDDYLSTLIAQAQGVAENFTRVSFPDDAPEPVRLAVLLLVGFYYENRETTDKGTAEAVMLMFRNLLYPYRDCSKMF